MCNRYVTPEEAAIERLWQIKHNSVPRWPKEVFPRALGPFIRTVPQSDDLELVVGQWGLIPWFAKEATLPYSTNNARFGDITSKASYKHPWQHGKRCIIPAHSFDEPCWESGKNIWWRFHRADGAPWGLAGVWNAWAKCGIHR
jgi:putative SOS response-associated peptidase YedK